MMTFMGVLQQFIGECNQDERLREMNRDWTRRIQFISEDSDERHYILCEEGFLSADRGELANPDMEIRATEDILKAVFSGQMTPTEPYNAGDLMVRGHQDDLMRLDIITLLIWGE